MGWRHGSKREAWTCRRLRRNLDSSENAYAVAEVDALAMGWGCHSFAILCAIAQYKLASSIKGFKDNLRAGYSFSSPELCGPLHLE